MLQSSYFEFMRGGSHVVASNKVVIAAEGEVLEPQRSDDNAVCTWEVASHQHCHVLQVPLNMALVVTVLHHGLWKVLYVSPEEHHDLVRTVVVFCSFESHIVVRAYGTFYFFEPFNHGAASLGPTTVNARCSELEKMRKNPYSTSLHAEYLSHECVECSLALFSKVGQQRCPSPAGNGSVLFTSTLGSPTNFVTARLHEQNHKDNKIKE